MQSVKQPYELPLCDIVMEGGITSGIIYPKAVVKLSKRFRIKNIGGTSAGAIAAAATAASELGRLRDPEADPGFKRLEGLADELSKEGFSGKKSTRLMDLFQPQKNTRPLFRMLISSLNKGSMKCTAIHLGLGAIRAFHWKIIGPAILVSWLIALIVIDTQPNLLDWLVVIASGFVGGTIAMVFVVYSALTGSMVKNGYGLCKGYDRNAEKLAVGSIKEPLTLWLSRMLNQCAGLEPDGTPLTFGDLWSGTQDKRSQPPSWLRETGLKDWHYIELQMMTTNVTHGRPYRFPNLDEDLHLYFRESELLEWFPSNIVKHMVDHARDYSKNRNAEELKTLPDGYFMLPLPKDLPVVFATRLSLSFPFLLSAVPLYATDFENPDMEQRKVERCWFSDGGISSNFPIHLFDAPLPRWPTFGIKLEKENTRHRPIKEDLRTSPSKPSYENRFFFPESNATGHHDCWEFFDDEDHGRDKLLGFISGLLSSSRNWRDNMLTRAPGIRDRVVRVYLKKNEGGLNLNMEDDLVRGLAKLGEHAAKMLDHRFSPESTDPMNFDNHRWVRLRTLATLLEQDFKSIHHSLKAAPEGAMTWDSLAKNVTYPKGNRQFPINGDQELKLLYLLNNLEQISVIASTAPTMLDGNIPKRMPTIRIVPDM